MQKTGAEILLASLKNEGVKYIFGNPGTTEVAILDALVETPEIEYILTLHESVAVAMADGYARAGGGVGFVNVHTALGLSNAIGGLCGAHIDGIPMVLTIANKDSRILGRGVFSEVDDICAMTRQFTKWSWQVLRPENIADDITRAFKITTTPPTGPVFLSIPEDFLALKMNAKIPPSQRFDSQPRLCPNPEDIKKAIKLLLAAKKPVMIAGNEIAQTDALPQAVELAELLGIPVLAEGRQSMAYLNFPLDHPLYRGGFEAQSATIKTADLILGVGCEIFVQTAYSENDAVLQKIKTVHMHSNPAVIGKLYPVEAPILSDAKEGLAILISQIKASASAQRIAVFRERFNQMKTDWAKREAIRVKEVESIWGKTPIRVAQLVREIQDAADPDAIIVDDTIRSSRPLLKHYQFKHPGTYFRSPAGYLGWGLPAALGVKLALPRRQVIAFVGDGGFIMTNPALWTAARYKIPVITIVCNNRQYKAVKDGAIRFKGKALEKNLFIGSNIDNPVPDLAQMAESFGVAGYTVKKPSQIKTALKKALNSGKPSVLDVWIEQ
ncbi:MAG: thiamine pyrophosphate-binding protein [Desulfobacterales bacterium]|nr:thiamine pyrophosphate-binding protein [Desulfobacterales bacterium]